MPEIIDVIAPPLAGCFTFTLPALPYPDYISAVAPGAPSYGINAIGNNTFLKGDSLHILSCGIKIQEGFTHYLNAGLPSPDPLPSVSFVPYGVVTAQGYAYVNFGSQRIFICMENYEQVVDTYLFTKDAVGIVDPTKDLNYENYYLEMSMPTGLYVSLLGAPVTLTGKTFYIVPFFKVSHTFAMV